jgi:hypothetical protein
VVDLCPEWLKPQRTAQYFGSANKGLGFYLVDVEDKEYRFKHWEGMDNFGLLQLKRGILMKKGSWKT